MDSVYGADNARWSASVCRQDPFEAAAIDGATDMQAFFRLTLPMMSKDNCLGGADTGHRPFSYLSTT